MMARTDPLIAGLWELAHECGSEFFESRCVQRLGEDVRQVLFGGDELDVNQLVLAHLSEVEVTLFLYFHSKLCYCC